MVQSSKKGSFAESPGLNWGEKFKGHGAMEEYGEDCLGDGPLDPDRRKEDALKGIRKKKTKSWWRRKCQGEKKPFQSRRRRKDREKESKKKFIKGRRTIQ